ncbi:MAG: polysaccharide biosynthesis protein [Clostridiales bacterium]|nr:polysaccharide biosynthesis protein [Clostridiales bacterium]
MSKHQLNKPLRTILWLILDAVLVNISMIFALELRYGEYIVPDEFYAIYWRIAPAAMILSLVVFIFFGIYRTMWQYASAEDLIRLTLATFVAMLSIYLGGMAANLFVTPKNLFLLQRSIYLLHWLLSTALIGLSRILYRLYVRKECFPLLKKAKHDVRRVMIIGAGWTGANLVHEMLRGNYGKSIPVVVVDDDTNRNGSAISGVPVVRGSGNILRLASDYSIDEIIIAISTPHGDLKSLVEKCLATGCRVKRIAPMEEVTSLQAQNKVRAVNLSDLLGRPEETLDMTHVAAMCKDKTVLITGGGGSIGSELCRRLLPLKPARIVLYDISENYMYDLLSELSLRYGDSIKEQVILCVGSVRDESRLAEIFQLYKPEIVLHAAAHKHVPLMEDCPIQAVKNNVFGTYLTAKAAIACKAQRFVLISTDKAVNPTNVMGATKRMAEMIIEAMNQASETEFTAVRFGNVLGSHGSVVPKFEQQIRSGGPVTLTHPEIIRYFMTIPEAASLVLQAASIAKGGELFVLDMGRPMKILELAQRMIQLYADDSQKVEIVYTGLRPGEKLYEELLLAGEGISKTENEKIFVAQPEVFTMEQIDAMLEELQHCMDDQTDMRACMHRLVPTFREPAEINKAALEQRSQESKAVSA